MEAAPRNMEECFHGRIAEACNKCAREGHMPEPSGVCEHCRVPVGMPHAKKCKMFYGTVLEHQVKPSERVKPSADFSQWLQRQDPDELLAWIRRTCGASEF
jgi:hypothetical protein